MLIYYLFSMHDSSRSPIEYSWEIKSLVIKPPILLHIGVNFCRSAHLCSFSALWFQLHRIFTTQNVSVFSTLQYSGGNRFTFTLFSQPMFQNEQLTRCFIAFDYNKSANSHRSMTANYSQYTWKGIGNIDIALMTELKRISTIVVEFKRLKLCNGF